MRDSIGKQANKLTPDYHMPPDFMIGNGMPHRILRIVFHSLCKKYLEDFRAPKAQGNFPNF
jgi:hypothetical protein